MAKRLSENGVKNTRSGRRDPDWPIARRSSANPARQLRAASSVATLAASADDASEKSLQACSASAARASSSAGIHKSSTSLGFMWSTTDPKEQCVYLQPRLTCDDRKPQRMHASGESASTIAAALGVGRATCLPGTCRPWQLAVQSVGRIDGVAGLGRQSVVSCVSLGQSSRSRRRCILGVGCSCQVESK